MQRRTLFAAMAVTAATLAFAGFAHAQERDLLDWSWTAEPVNSAGPQRTYRLEFEARIAEGFIIYGSDFAAELGPRPTRLRFDQPDVKAEGPLVSLNTQRRTDKVFKTEYTYFDGKAHLAQTVVVPSGASRLTGTIQGQTCDETDGTCALFSRKFDIDLR